MNKFVETAAKALARLRLTDDGTVKQVDLMRAEFALASLAQHRDDIARVIEEVPLTHGSIPECEAVELTDAVLALFKEDA